MAQDSFCLVVRLGSGRPCFLLFFTSEKEPKVSLASAENADWRGFAPATGDIVPQKTLHLQNGTVKLSFPSQTTVSISGPAYFQVVDHRTLEVFDGNVVIDHQGKRRVQFVNPHRKTERLRPAFGPAFAIKRKILELPLKF